MSRFSVGEIVEAGQCARRFALARSGAERSRPRGTPVGALVHAVASELVEAAPADAALAALLESTAPDPDRVAAHLEAAADARFLRRIAGTIDRLDGDDLFRAGRALRELARLFATLVRRARAAGAPANQAAARALVATERSFVVSLPTASGAVEVSGRFDLLLRNAVDQRLEVWELKTYADDGEAAADQAQLYAFALARAGVEAASGTGAASAALRPAVLQLGEDGRVTLRAVAAAGDRYEARLVARLAAMAGWAAAPQSAPPTDQRERCVRCALQGECWRRHGPTIDLETAAAAPPRSPAAPSLRATPSPATPARLPIVSVLLGHDAGGGEIRWAPGDPERPLDNFGLLVTGDAGSGKTQTLRAIIAELRATGLPTLIIDFKNDFADPAFAAACGLTVHDVRDRGLPYNPLSLSPQRGAPAGSGWEVRPRDHAYRFAGIMGRVLRLGVQQEAALRRALLDCYAARGLDRLVHPVTGPVPGPGLAEVLAAIDHPTLCARLEPFVDLGLLRGDEAGDLAGLLDAGAVLDLHLIADATLGNALVELTLLAAHSHLLAGEQPRRLRRLLVLDEAHRVAESAELAWLLREGRAFGLGSAIATQYPGDLRDEIQGALATKLFLRNDQDAHRAAVCRQLLGTLSGDEATRIRQALRDLGRLEGYLTNSHYRPYARLRVLPHHERG